MEENPFVMTMGDKRNQGAKSSMKNFIDRVKEDWTSNPLSVVDTAVYVIVGVACIKYLRKR